MIRAQDRETKTPASLNLRLILLQLHNLHFSNKSSDIDISAIPPLFSISAPLYSKTAATPPKTRAPNDDPRATAAPVARTAAVVVPLPAVVTGVADGDGEATLVGATATVLEIVQGQLVMVRVVASVAV